jgi:hypothetical protein
MDGPGNKPNGDEPQSSDRSNRKRNRVNIISSDSDLVDSFGNLLNNNGFRAEASSIDGLVKDFKFSVHDFYVVDLYGMDDFSDVRQAIINLRENTPDNEIIVLHANSMLKRPEAARLNRNIERYLVTLKNRPTDETVESYERSARNVVQHIRKYLSQPHLIKIGGSIWDLYEKDPNILERLLGQIRALHGEGYAIALTTGGGPRLDVESGLSRAHGQIPNAKPVLERQARNIRDLLGDAAEITRPSKLQDFYRSHLNAGYFEAKIPIFYLSEDSWIRDTESDTHTLKIADRLSYKTIFAKFTDGVYKNDPNKDPRRVRVALWPFPISADESNQFFPHIYSADILNGVINRQDSEGKGEHLIESAALSLLSGMETRRLRAVQVLDGTSPALLRYALDGQRFTQSGLQRLAFGEKLGPKDYVGSFILRGDAPLRNH